MSINKMESEDAGLFTDQENYLIWKNNGEGASTNHSTGSMKNSKFFLNIYPHWMYYRSRTKIHWSQIILLYFCPMK